MTEPGSPAPPRVRSGRLAAANRVDHHPVAAHRKAQVLGVAVAVDVAMDALHLLVHRLRHAVDGFLHQSLSLLHSVSRLLDELLLKFLEAPSDLGHLPQSLSM